MADNNNKKDDLLQEMQTQIEGFTIDMKTLHKWLDSTEKLMFWS
jgi:hypothetical protein